MKKNAINNRITELPDYFVKKGEFVLREGEMTNSAYYVVKGCLRAYIIDEKGKEHIYLFAPEDWIISDEEALFENKPAVLYIDAIEDTIVKILNKVNGSVYPDIEKEEALQFIEKLSKKANSFRKRIILLLSASAKERYETFIKTYPNLSQRVPLKMIASYLGVTPEGLSRVRKELVSKNK